MPDENAATATETLAKATEEVVLEDDNGTGSASESAPGTVTLEELQKAVGEFKTQR